LQVSDVIEVSLSIQGCNADLGMKATITSQYQGAADAKGAGDTRALYFSGQSHLSTVETLSDQLVFKVKKLTSTTIALAVVVQPFPNCGRFSSDEDGKKETWTLTSLSNIGSFTPVADNNKDLSTYNDVEMVQAGNQNQYKLTGNFDINDDEPDPIFIGSFITSDIFDISLSLAGCKAGNGIRVTCASEFQGSKIKELTDGQSTTCMYFSGSSHNGEFWDPIDMISFQVKAISVTRIIVVAIVQPYHKCAAQGSDGAIDEKWTVTVNSNVGNFFTDVPPSQQVLNSGYSPVKMVSAENSERTVTASGSFDINDKDYDPIYLGSFAVEDVVDVTLHLSGCNSHTGVKITIVSQQQKMLLNSTDGTKTDGLYFSGGSHLGAFVDPIDYVEFKVQALSAFRIMLVAVVSPYRGCGGTQDQKESWTTTVTSGTGKFTANIPEQYQTFESFAPITMASASLENSWVQSGQFQGNDDEPDVIILGSFSTSDVVDISLSLTGCHAHNGLKATITGSFNSDIGNATSSAATNGIYFSGTSHKQEIDSFMDLLTFKVKALTSVRMILAIEVSAFPDCAFNEDGLETWITTITSNYGSYTKDVPASQQDMADYADVTMTSVIE
jgi:hypothetical protein